MERVTVVRGDAPLLVIAPHGRDDLGTSEIAQNIAKELNCYCVTNNGWRRSTDVDAIGGYANCNDVRHCHEEVVKDEVLDPILGFSNRIIKDYGFGHIFIIHGMGHNSPDLVVGYGEGSVPSYSCKPILKDVFIKLCRDNSISAYAAGPDSKFSGKAKNNLNQLFKRWYPKDRLNSMQLEIAVHLRTTSMIKTLSVCLASIMDEITEYDDSKLYGFKFIAPVSI